VDAHYRNVPINFDFFFKVELEHFRGSQTEKKKQPFFLMLWVNFSGEGLNKFEMFFLGVGTILHPEKKISNTNTLFDNITTCKLHLLKTLGVCML
jgi:hypothetical protein